MLTPRRLPRPGKITITKALMLIEGVGRGNGERKRAVPRHLTPYHPTIAFYISIHICTLALVSTPKYVLFYHQVLLSPLSPFLSPLVQVEHRAWLAEITAFRGVCSVTLWFLDACAAGER